MKKVHIMPASANTIAPFRYVAVKYGANTEEKLWTVSREHGVNAVYLPDRTVYEGNPNSMTLGVTSVDYDEILPLSLTNPESFSKVTGVGYAMLAPDRSAKGIKRNPYVKIFSDSGGFQLAQGVRDFVDLDELASFYHAHVDFGIGLDVPLSPGLQNSEWFLRMAKVTALNNAYITRKLAEKKSSAMVLDVSHGLIPTNRRKYNEFVLANQGSRGMAIGGVGNSVVDTQYVNFVSSVLNMLLTLHMSKGCYDRYHMLGSTSPNMIMLYTLFTEQGLAPLITADSTTYLRASVNSTFKGPRYSSDSVPVQYTLPAKPISFGLPCACPVCSILKFPQAHRLSVSASILHSLNSMTEEAEVIMDMTKCFLKGQVKLDEILYFIHGSRVANLNLVRRVVRWVQDQDLGFNKAWAKHKDILSPYVRSENQGQGLFGGVARKPSPKDAVTTKAIERYEEFHAKT